MNENEINYNEISGRIGYDILIGANNGEETRRANNLTPWKGDFEIYNSDSEKPEEDKYLTFTALEDESSIRMVCSSSGYDSCPVSFEYSIDSGKTWNNYELNYDSEGGTWITEPIELNTRDSVKLRGTNANLGVTDEKSVRMNFQMQGLISASGDVTSLINNEGGDCELVNQICFIGLFGGCTSLTTAPNLPSTTLSNGCYYQMFAGCTSLETAPELPATTLATDCYYYMFGGCSSLEIVPVLLATELADNCYTGMFKSCTSLTQLPQSEYDGMISYKAIFYGSGIQYVENEYYAYECWEDDDVS